MLSLTSAQRRRFKLGVDCALVPDAPESLADFFALIGEHVSPEGEFWFRGHADREWGLFPTALRSGSEEDRSKALALFDAFRQVAEMKLERLPDDHDKLGWHQVAQHYGLPTRLLDWSENPLVSLYFAVAHHSETDGVVLMLNPRELNQDSLFEGVLDAKRDRGTVDEYLGLDGGLSESGTASVAVNPVWNSDRILLQRGKFTIHGSRDDGTWARTPSLAAIAIGRDSKHELRSELEGVGVDEMSLFPELEHACRHLKRRAGLEAS